ncbi:MAG: 23S rRNA (pseudouridine(1915)-N(3))-methyltransferase RlmH [Gemmatimonadetes bacterium]|nr:23S rRNA (pseudouridine(1915)-N(3))-methyltransferase RlmH [Gemmatimonadota bacterium]MYG23134.1 23S rRNA (pseudouridine(1915)-N(3))-methyltransferase RlmH [Gemmatimonadota bacterium]MYJ38572.1 23S rRNA (pseudouridine(1915)-N(3))-methyltransferase RlmH [Gemmatimonadota bacterium]
MRRRGIRCGGRPRGTASPRSHGGGGTLTHVSIVAVGKPGGLSPVIRDYEARAARYWRFEAVEVAQARGRAAAEVMRKEADSIRRRLRTGHLRVAVTRRGRRMSSPELARWLERLVSGPEPGVHFIIGGAFGLDARLREECDLSLSLSPFTLPHDLARVVLTEQLYRAGTILRREPYHKGSE